MTAPAPRSLLSQVSRGRAQEPVRALLYGVPGVGKTTMAASAPGVVFLPVEDGCGALDVARLPQPRTWAEVRASVQALTEQPHDFATLAIDTLDAAEALCWAEVVKNADSTKIRTIEDFGYGKGYVAAVDLWRGLLADLEQLQRKRGMGVLLIAHSNRKPFRNPEGEDYDRWTLALQERAAGLIVGWCHEVLFCRWEVVVASAGDSKAKGVSTGNRVMLTQESGPWTAKNRHGLPAQLPLGWASLANALIPPDGVRARIQCALSGADDDLRQKVEEAIKQAGEDVQALLTVEKRLAKTLAEKGK